MNGWLLLAWVVWLVNWAWWLGYPAPLRPLPYEMETYFTPEEWYTELTRDEQDELCRQMDEAIARGKR